MEELQKNCKYCVNREPGAGEDLKKEQFKNKARFPAVEKSK